MRQPWDRSQRFPVITAGGEFGTSLSSKSERFLHNSCKPGVLCHAYCIRDLPSPKCGCCGWLAFPEGEIMKSKAELQFLPSPAAGVQKRLQGVEFVLVPASIRNKGTKQCKLKTCFTSRRLRQSFSSGIRASLCILEGCGTT